MTMHAKSIRYLTIVAAALLIAVLIYIVVIFLDSETDVLQRKKVVQQITIIAPPPPPPPPPEQEPEIQDPEEEAVIDEMDEAMPEEGMDEDVGDDLGLDADGSAGGDSFGLLARKGGRGIVGGGYGALIVQEINSMLVDDDRLRHKEYTVILQLWISDTGDIQRYKIDEKSAESDVIEMIRLALVRLGSVSSGPPLELPQPIRLRIRSRI